MRSWRRLALILAGGLAALLLLGSLLTARFFVWPPSDDPQRADAVVVLSGDHGERLPVGLELIRTGVARVLVLAGTPDSSQVLELCRGGQAFEVVCLRPEPDSTRAEARAAAELASERRWRTMVVVTSTFHLTRAGMLFDRCFDGTVLRVAGRPTYGVKMATRQVIHEWLGVGYSLLMDRDC